MATRKAAWRDIAGNEIPEEKLPQQYILFADGTIVPGAASVDSDGYLLWIWTDADSGITLMDMITLASEGEKTKVIQYYLNGSMRFKWKKYQTLWSCSQIATGSVKVAMKK